MTRPLRVVLAPDSFKGSIAAADAAEAIARGWLSIRPDDDVLRMPQADGGEGTLDALAAALPDSVWHVVHGARGPDGRSIDARWLELPDGTAAVELAEVSGLPLMARPDPLGATTFGLGQVLRDAVLTGVERIIVGLGGSASTDGGAGALQALGLRVRDANGEEVAPGGAALLGAASVDSSALLPPPAGGVRLLVDVSSGLLGPAGAAAVFSPQKGADAEHVELLETALARWNVLIGGTADAAGAGAAGGTGYGLMAAWGAVGASGSESVARLSGLDAAIAGADVVVTGEGRFDATSLLGKVVGNITGLAAANSTDLIVIAGRIDAQLVGGSSISLTDLVGAERALAQPAAALRLAGARAAKGY